MFAIILVASFGFIVARPCLSPACEGVHPFKPDAEATEPAVDESETTSVETTEETTTMEDHFNSTKKEETLVKRVARDADEIPTTTANPPVAQGNLVAVDGFLNNHNSHIRFMTGSSN